MLSHAVLVAVFLITLASAPLSGDTAFWEFGNGIGFIALAGILILTLNGRSGAGSGKQHRWVGFAVLAAMWCHALWFVLGDPLTIEYLKFGAPAYMTAGLLALGLCSLLSFSSLKRVRTSQYGNHKHFRVWHRWLSTIVLLASAWHIVMSGYYFTAMHQCLILAALMAFTYVYSKRTSAAPVKLHATALLLTSVITLSLFVAIRIIPQTWWPAS